MKTTLPRLSDQALSDLVRHTMQAQSGHGLWKEVGAQILAIVREKAPTLGFEQRVERELENDGVSHLFEQVRNGKWNPAAGHFRGWAWRVLKNFGKQVAREMHSRRASSRYGTGRDVTDLPSPHDPRDSDDPIGNVTMEHAVGVYRSMLDEAATFITRADLHVDYFAVFLLELRRAATVRAFKSLDSEAAAGADVPGFVETCFPWHSAESDRHFKPNYPSLRVIWAEVARFVQETHRPPAASEFCTIVSKLLLNVGGHLTVAAWIKLSQRSRAVMQDAMDPEQWDRWFAHWWTRRSRANGGVTG